mmetsp:Transcript_15707/g.28050  ORF Transcript_15707/g.28050 Transcript_15707/m.28050 type:complete len:325 (-) Transcript_15707:30-1004(-)
MHTIAIVLTCLTWAGLGRRMRPSAEQAVENQKSLSALATLLQAFSPTDAFHPSASGVPKASMRRSVAVAAPRRTAAMQMQEAAEVEETKVPFEIRWSLGNVVSGTGAIFFTYSIGSFLLQSGENQLVQTLGFVYSIPALVGGLALKYAELPPVPLESTPEAEALRETKGSKIQKKIVKDMTRYTYGDAHMEDPLRFLKLAPSGRGVPNICNLKETVTKDGRYSLAMRFNSPDTPYRMWKDRSPRYAKFFGPGVRAQLKIYSKKDQQVELTLISCDEDEDMTALEELPDGTLARIVTSAEKYAAEEEAKRNAPKDAPKEEPRGAV